jgi:rsbT co-antagonist protein RsbR
MFAQWLEEHQEEITQAYIAQRREQGDPRPEEAMRAGLKVGILSLVQAVRKEEHWRLNNEEMARRALESGTPLEILAEAISSLYVAVRQVLYDERPPQLAEWLGVLGERSLTGSQIATKIMASSMEELIARRTEELAVFQTMVENSLDAIFTVDLDTRFTFANRATCEMFGCDYESQEMIGQLGTDYWPEEDLPILTETVMPQVVAGGWSGEVRQKRKDGTLFDGSAALIPLRDSEGQPVGVALTLRDITERKRVEEALRKSEQRHRDLITNLADWVWEVDAQGRYTYSSEQVTDMLGYSVEEILGKTPFDFIKPDEAARIGEIFGEIAAAKAPIVNLENWNITQDGREVCMLTNGTPLLDEDGNLTGYHGIDRDITGRKQAELEQQRAQQQLIEAQQQALKELSTPVIPIMERIIVMPLVGEIDSMRAKDIMRVLLLGIREHRARVVILDITGVPIVDSGVAAHLDKTIQAARLKGARTIITGVSDEVAEAIVDLGIDWSKLDTLSDLRTGLVAALESLGIRLSKA